jgi:hypothetical protein
MKLPRLWRPGGGRAEAPVDARPARLRISERVFGSVEYATTHRDAQWLSAWPATRLELPPAIEYGHLRADFRSKLDERIPELGVLRLQRGCVLGIHGWIFSQAGDLLPEHSWYGMHVDELREQFPDRPRPIRREEGVVASLVSDFCGFNYGHFLLDGLGRLALLEQAGIALTDIDRFIITTPNRAAERLLERAGVPMSRCIRTEPGTAIQPDVLLAPSFPGARRSYRPWLPPFLQRHLLVQPPGPPHRRLYLPRATNRRISNEEVLLPILLENGFEVFDPAAHADPPAVFAEAAVVVGAHGAALSDLAFCQPGARVLELIPTDHAQPFWYTLSWAAGLRYGYLMGISTGMRPPDARGKSFFDFEVDPAEFREALATTLEGAPPVR